MSSCCNLVIENNSLKSPLTLELTELRGAGGLIMSRIYSCQNFKWCVLFSRLSFYVTCNSTHPRLPAGRPVVPSRQGTLIKNIVHLGVTNHFVTLNY
jgi:hypothetical protein